MSKANSNRVYALIETGDGVPAVNVADPERGELWRSDDGGDNWPVVSYDRQLAGPHALLHPHGGHARQRRTRRTSSPRTGPRRSTAARRSSIRRSRKRRAATITTSGSIRPTANRMIGEPRRRRLDHRPTAARPGIAVQLPIAQMYHVDGGQSVPVLTSTATCRTARPPAVRATATRLRPFGGGIPRGLWHSVGGGESGWATPDPEDPNIVWSSASGFGSVGGIVVRYDVRTGVSSNVEVWPRRRSARRRRRQVPLRLDLPAHDLAARSQQASTSAASTCTQTTDGGKHLAGDQSRPDAERQEPAASRQAGSRPTTSASSTRAWSSPSRSRGSRPG